MTEDKRKISNISNNSLNLTRRAFLKGSLQGMGVALALPIFDYMLNSHGTAFAQGAPFPKRFGMFAWGLGYGRDINHWNASGSGFGDDWQIPASGHGLTPLLPYKDYLTVFSNYSHPEASGAGHIPQRGIGFSASHNPTWVLNSGANGFRRQNMPLASIDSIIQSAWASEPDTALSYLNLSADVGSLYVGTSSWNTGGSYRTFHRNPVSAFDELIRFGGGTPAPPPPGDEPTAADITNRFKKSVLDATLDDMASFRNRLDPIDRLRLDQHTESVRSLERQIAQLINMQGEQPTCGELSQPAQYSRPDEIVLRNNIMADLILYALTCNLTRVFCYEFTPTQCNGLIPDINLTNSSGVHDGYSHSNTQGMRDYLTYVTQNMASMVGKMQGVTEGAGNMLDNMLMVGTSEYAGPHHHRGHPYIYVGKAAGGLLGNYHSMMSDTSNSEASRILLTAAHAIGVPLQSFGMESRSVSGDSGGPSSTRNYRATQPITEVLA